MRMFVAVAILLTLGVAGIFWFTSDSLAFQPEPGDTRYFILEQSTELQLQSSTGFHREPTRIHMESLLRSDVLSADGDVVELQSRAMRTQVWEQDYLGLDTEQVPEYDDRLQTLADLLKAGVVEKVASDGRVLETAYVNEAAMTELAEDLRLPAAIQDMLQRDLSVMYAYQPGFPSGRLRAGLSWQVPPRTLGDQQLPAVQYEVSHVEEDSVSLRFQAVKEQAPSGTTDLTVEVEGFMELERLTGWPRRAAVHINGDFEDAGELINVASTMTLVQAGIEPRFEADHVWNRARGALESLSVAADDPDFETYLQPSFEWTSAEESFEQIDRTLLWFGNKEIDGRLGLEFQSDYHHFSMIGFESVSAVRLLDAEGEPVIEKVPLDPRYTLQPYVYNDRRLRSVPFIASELTAEQLEAIATVEVDAGFTVPDEFHSFVLTPESPSRHIDTLGVTLSVDDWNAGELQVRAHEAGGSLPATFPLVRTYPVNAEGDALSAFSLRITHTVLEPLREAFLEKPDEGNSWDRGERFAKQAAGKILRLPMAERRGDWIYKLKSESGQAIEGVQIHVHSWKTQQRTFAAPSAIPMLQGGEVVGERTLEPYQEPELEFLSFEMDEITLDGIQQNRLNVVVPGGDAGRCDVSLAGEPSYQGSPVSFLTPQAQSSGFAQLLFASSRYNQVPGSELATAHGLKYFYDFEALVNIDCITEVVMHRGPVPEDGRLTKVGASTLRLSKSQHQTLTQIQNRFNLRDLPLVAYNRNGKILEPLPPAHSGTDLRFWGEIAEIRYPARMEREARQVSVSFPPLP